MKKNPDLDGLAKTSMEEIQNLDDGEFRVWVFLQFQSIYRRLNWNTYLLILVLASILGTAIKEVI